jgi:uncharacterized protein Yka (UPF0111/DUF47 family)
MLKKFIPRQDNFFVCFQKAAYELVAAAKQFVEMIQHPSQAQNYARLIAEHEDMGDSITRETFDLLHKTFITPFDRNDIHQLTRKLDDILDTINRTAQRIRLYQYDRLPQGITQIGNLVMQAATSIKDILKQLENLKNTPTIIQLCRAISQADSDGEQIMLEGVGELFAQDTDFKYLLKTKEIFEYSKSILRECHDLADIIKGIVLEYS